MATTASTAARRVPATNVVDFDAERKKAKAAKRAKKAGIKPLRAFGRDWTLKRPNLALVGELEASDNLKALTDYVLAHIEKAERPDFLQAMLDDEDFDLEDVLQLGEKVTEAVYADLPS